MKDLIERADAIKVFIDWGMKEFGFHDFNRNERFINALNALPTAEKQGEWIYCEDDEGQDGYRCSECGFFVPWYYGYEDINYIYKYHACPSCLARMKVADDEEVDVL